MALSVKIESIVQSNDAVTLQVNDTTGEYNATTNTGGWGSPNPPVTAVDGSTVHLYLDVTVTTSNGTETVYDQIELFDTFGPFTTVNDLSFDITADMLTSGGTPMGTSTDQLDDGWYKIVYSFVDDGVTYTDSTVTEELLISGQVRQGIYQKLTNIPYSNEWKLFNHDYKEWYDIVYPIYYSGLHVGMKAEETVARKNLILDSLATLERLLNN